MPQQRLDPRISPTGIAYTAPSRGEEVELPSPDDKASTPPCPARTPVDAYAVVGITPEQVVGLRPRWSLKRARLFLVEQEVSLREHLESEGTNQLLRLLEHRAGPALQRDRPATNHAIPGYRPTPGTPGYPSATPTPTASVRPPPFTPTQERQLNELRNFTPYLYLSQDTTSP